MKIAAFYENIYDGVRAMGRQMEDVLEELRGEGMTMRYITG